MGITWDRRQWRDADSLAAIGELTARWLEGTLAYQPEDFATQPAPETRPLVPVLAPLNRAGYVTTNSQPGVALRAGSGQRAFVTGYCDELSLRRPERAVRDTDLVLLAFRPYDGGGEPVVVTMRDGEEATWLGRPVSADYIRHAWDQDVAPAGVSALLAALQFQLFDPEWGRKELLWRRLRHLY
ncbi:DUF6919 domain-containing protein [Quadrisphaera sp. INWT6]|uniref:DUF6919 domain-containing protein n=1 Tax=Quadrisphaera sp. INWT6 TaxID=2596917 RepID=UPI0018927EA5|nr:hypothetical protein [Quadrisphaera sp. INWT6]MBF5081496.1 hypothetical protein [Quadrisphaera sp. INWT6]